MIVCSSADQEVIFLSSSQTSKRSESELAGRTDGNVKVIFPESVLDPVTGNTTTFTPGDYVTVKVRL